MRKRTILPLLLAAALMLSLFTGCAALGGDRNTSPTARPNTNSGAAGNNSNNGNIVDDIGNGIKDGVTGVENGINDIVGNGGDAGRVTDGDGTIGNGR